MAFGELVVVYDLLPEIAAKLDETLDKVVRRVAFDIQALAQAEAQVDTGFMKGSVYVVTDKESTYDQATPPVKEGQELLPEVERPEKHHAIVAVGASYGVFQEFGTAHMPAHPFLSPAAALGQVELEAALTKLEEMLTVL